MNLFELFGKKAKRPPQEKEAAEDGEALDIYSGMRVEVTAFEGELLFV